MTQATVTAPAPARVTPHALSADSRRAALAQVREYVPGALTLLAAAWWVIIAARWWGGRAPGSVTGGAIVTLVALVAVRPDRVLPRKALVLACLLSIAAFTVALTAPTGWAGAPAAARLVCAAWTVVVVAAAVVRDHRVVNQLMVLLIVATMVEFAEAWLPWWGGGSPSHPLIGTFYWWNPFATFLIAGTAIGLAFFLDRTGALATLGLIGFAMGTIGVVYSTSRAAAACLWLVLGGVVLCHLLRRKVSGVARAIAGMAVAAISVWAIAGPPFFPHRSAPLAGTAARSAGQSLVTNGTYRLDYWREALNVFRRFPITGGGYHSLATESAGHVPAGWPLSPLAHNAYLQVLAAGGLVLAVPFLLGCAAIAWFVIRALISQIRSESRSAVDIVVPLTLGALMLHAGVDFDWSYPANLMLAAVLAGVVAGCRWTAPSQPHRGSGSRVAAAAALIGVALICLAAVTAWSGDMRLSLPVHGSSQSAAPR